MKNINLAELFISRRSRREEALIIVGSLISARAWSAAVRCRFEGEKKFPKMQEFVRVVFAAGNHLTRVRESPPLQSGSGLPHSKPWRKFSRAFASINSAVVLLILFLSFISAAQPLQKPGPTFNWDTKPQLFDAQSDLLHLYNRLEAYSTNAEMQRDINGQITTLKSKLGTNAVRFARADELLVSKTSQTNVCSVFNSTSENIVFTVSIKGDEEWMGSRKASMGRQTFLPPHGMLLVTNMYWTTPKMKFVE